jgi:hypothetical protein
MAVARRLLEWPLRATIRRALLTVCFLPASQGVAQEITDASYIGPTSRYAHGVLGDAIEHESLLIQLSDGTSVTHTLPHSDVFEDTNPRLLDVDADGTPEVLVVQSNRDLGAKLAIYDQDGLVADTPNIGQRNRWLAPIGAADLDGDGVIEIAYIDRPHLVKALRIWRFENGRLNSAADLAGYTNHRIGERDIAGGMRTCAARPPEMIVATADWSKLVAITFDGATLKTTMLGRDTSRSAFAKAMKCTDQ